MQWAIPGTVISADTQDAAQIENQFRSMFLAGGMVLSQVSSLTGLESYTIQNWVKRGFLSKPEKKRYSLGQLCRIININMLKSALTLEQICGLLHYINGQLDDESDDLISDADLTFLFIRLAAVYKERGTEDPKKAIAHVLGDYPSLAPDARERVAQVLNVMLTAWASAQLQQKATAMIRQLQ